jgi:hypothetical protein
MKGIGEEIVTCIEYRPEKMAQRVSEEGEMSDEGQVGSGVPKGAVVG